MAKAAAGDPTVDAAGDGLGLAVLGVQADTRAIDAIAIAIAARDPCMAGVLVSFISTR